VILMLPSARSRPPREKTGLRPAAGEPLLRLPKHEDIVFETLFHLADASGFGSSASGTSEKATRHPWELPSLASLRAVCPERSLRADKEIEIMQTATAIQHQPTVNSVVHGDCIEVMRTMRSESIDFVLTDPPYLVSYRDRAGRTIQNDQNDAWMLPAFREIYRVLKPNRFLACFYGWSRVDRFLGAWHAAGFRVVGHMVFVKHYASASKFLRYQHEQAYLLAKGSPELPKNAIGDVIEMKYSGNRFHPTQKPVSALLPLIKSFSDEGDLVLDPFCGSGSTLVAAQVVGRAYLGIELDQSYFNIAQDRMQRRAARTQSVHSFRLGLILPAVLRASRRTKS